jgi:phosphoglycerate dehydrogenase-like enzyme
MARMTQALITQAVQPFLEGRLPAEIKPLWFDTPEELLALAPRAEIGWFDAFRSDVVPEAVGGAKTLRWLSTVAAGVDHLPLELMAQRGIVLTNGAGLHASAVAEYAILGMLAIAKGYREVVRAQDRREWLDEPPGQVELAGTSALIVGAGAIGGQVAELLRAFGVHVTEVRRSGAPGTLRPDAWRGRLGDFDWVILAVPSTAATQHMFGAEEFAAMKPGAAILNFARGEVIDTDALLASIDAERLGGAFLDVTDPEPLPPEHPLWRRDNVHISMHLSGRSQRTILQKGAERFLANCRHFIAGEPLDHVVDLRAGY